MCTGKTVAIAYFVAPVSTRESPQTINQKVLVKCMKQVQELQLQNEKLQCAHNEVQCVCQPACSRADDDTVTMIV